MAELNELTKKFAVYLTTRKYAPDIETALKISNELEAGKLSEELIKNLSRNMDIMMNVMPPITEEKLINFLTETLESAKKLFVFWENTPADTNAIFFRKSYNEIDWSEYE